jgi:hypothetical protein
MDPGGCEVLRIFFVTFPLSFSGKVVSLQADYYQIGRLCLIFCMLIAFPLAGIGGYVLRSR